MRKYADIDFRYEDVRAAGSLGPLFERIRAAFRAARDAIGEQEGVVRVVRYNAPPTTPPTAAALPAASAKLHGQVLLIDNNGTALDTLHICVRDAVGAYVWKQFTLF